MHQSEDHWDFFLAHAGQDIKQAEMLYGCLAEQHRVFLDANMEAGTQWPDNIKQAQENSSITVALLSPNSKNAYYLKEEIIQGIRLERRDPRCHRTVPVLLRGPKPEDLLYGLTQKQAVSVLHDDYASVAEKLRELLQHMKRTSWEDYEERLFRLQRYTVAYIPFLNRPGSAVTNVNIGDVEIVRDSSDYPLPEPFASTPINSKFNNDSNCRLSSFELRPGPRLRLTLSRTTYEDYLKSGEHLDDPLPNDPHKTLRDAYGSRIPEDSGGDLRNLQLANICGVGIFVISRDGYILVTKHSDKSHVYPGRLTFSASGTMKWGVHPHPFAVIICKAFEEIRHQVNPAELRMIGFGLDARRLYFQFSFCEEAVAEMAEIKKLCPSRSDPHLLPFEIGPIMDSLMTECWEPAAEAALLTLCIQRFGLEKVVQAVEKRQDTWLRRDMRDEWDDRASRQGVLADLSVRYPADQISSESARFVTVVMDFIGDDVKDKNTLELGAGTGRLTERLVDLARPLTCVDLCEKMLNMNRARLGDKASQVQYISSFAQDYRPPSTRHDVVVCSLVLIHNVEDQQFKGLMAKMCECADVLFVIEDVTAGRPTSPHTLLRRREDLVDAFASQGYRLVRSGKHQLFDDQIALLKLVRRRSSTQKRPAKSSGSRAEQAQGRDTTT
jgi:hypothetical protein